MVLENWVLWAPGIVVKARYIKMRTRNKARASNVLLIITIMALLPRYKDKTKFLVAHGSTMRLLIC